MKRKLSLLGLFLFIYFISFNAFGETLSASEEKYNKYTRSQEVARQKRLKKIEELKQQPIQALLKILTTSNRSVYNVVSAVFQKSDWKKELNSILKIYKTGNSNVKSAIRNELIFKYRSYPLSELTRDEMNNIFSLIAEEYKNNESEALGLFELLIRPPYYSIKQKASIQADYGVDVDNLPGKNKVMAIFFKVLNDKNVYLSKRKEVVRILERSFDDSKTLPYLQIMLSKLKEENLKIELDVAVKKIEKRNSRQNDFEKKERKRIINFVKLSGTALNHEKPSNRSGMVDTLCDLALKYGFIRDMVIEKLEKRKKLEKSRKAIDFFDRHINKLKKIK